MILVLCASFLVNLFSVDPGQSVFTMIIMASRYSFSGHCRERALFSIGMYRSFFSTNMDQKREQRIMVEHWSAQMNNTLQAQLVALGGDIIFINLQIVPRCFG